MAVPAPVTHLRISGVLGVDAAAPVESWTFGFYLGGAMLPDGYAAGLPAVWTAAAAYIGAAANDFTQEVWLTEVSAAAVKPDGRLDAGFYSRYAGNTPVKGGQIDNVPYQVSYAITLDAGAPAKGRFNRFYPPPQRGTLTGNQIPSSVATTRANAAHTLIKACGTAFGSTVLVTRPFNTSWTRFPETALPGLIPGVMSATNGSFKAIQNVRCGRVPDTQRRRRRNVPEGYQIKPFVYS